MCTRTRISFCICPTSSAAVLPTPTSSPYHRALVHLVSLPFSAFRSAPQPHAGNSCAPLHCAPSTPSPRNPFANLDEHGLAMNQLCVPVPSASNTHQILDEVFRLCRIPWIYDFIFRADPAADISMLLAPVQKRHALSARIFVNATETSSRYAHTFDFNKDLMFYSIPAFSIGPITAGFCVEQPAHFLKSNDMRSLQCIRFIRDDNAGIFLHVSENENTGVTEVDCLTHRSSTRRSRVRIKFDFHSLRSVLRTTRGILHPTDIAPSLIYLNVSDEKRSCPVCRDPTATQCSCPLPLRRPNHPLDFQYEANNMGLYTGFYQGATVVRLTSAGHCVINATLQSGSVIQGELNSEVTNRLHKLAVMNRLSCVKSSPASLLMPASPLNLPAMLATDTPEEAQAIAKDAEKVRDDDEGELDTDALFASEPPDVGMGGVVHGDELLSTADMILSFEDARSVGTREREESRFGLLDPGGDGGRVLEGTGIEGDVGKCTSSSSGSRDDVVTPVTVVTGEKDSPCSGMEDVTRGGIEGEFGIGSGGAGDSQSSGGRDGDKNEEDGGGSKVEMDKTEIRKQRNRAAAARSNLKRKLKNEQVRKDLATLTQRAIRLRVKEMMLRDENTRLRTALRQAGTNR